MPEALVLIDTGAYSAEEVLQELRACKEVQKCFMVTGAYDIIAKVEGKTFDQLVDVINRRIKRLFQVQETLSMIIVGSERTEQKQENGVIVS
jgi:DNA-binding Lrp family transcriptional regulator